MSTDTTAPLTELTPMDSEALISDVLSEEPFYQTKTETAYRIKEWPSQSLDIEAMPWIERIVEFFYSLFKNIEQFSGSIASLIGIAEILLWGLITLLLLVVLFSYPRWSALLQWQRRQRPPKPRPPTTLFGLDVRQGSLPEQPLQVAQTLWQQGQARDALSLLYRCTLVHLIHQHQLAVNDSYTEGECIQLVQQHSPTAMADFFAQLTHAWQALAYAHKTLSQQQFHTLCDDWQRHCQTGKQKNLKPHKPTTS